MSARYVIAIGLRNNTFYTATRSHDDDYSSFVFPGSVSLRSAHLSPRLQWSSRIDRACDLCRAATKKPRYFARITAMACPSLSIIRQHVRYVPARGTAVTGSLQLGVPMHAPPCAPTCTLAAPAYSLPLKFDPPYHR